MVRHVYHNAEAQRWRRWAPGILVLLTAANRLPNTPATRVRPEACCPVDEIVAAISRGILVRDRTAMPILLGRRGVLPQFLIRKSVGAS